MRKKNVDMNELSLKVSTVGMTSSSSSNSKSHSLKNETADCDSDSEHLMEKLKDMDFGCSECSNLFRKLIHHISLIHSKSHHELPVDLDPMVLIKTEQVQEIPVTPVDDFSEELPCDDWENSVDFDDRNEVNDFCPSPIPGPSRNLRKRRKTVSYVESNPSEYKNEHYTNPRSGKKPKKCKNYVCAEKSSAEEGKPFTCEICGKSFRTKSNLKEHSWTHTAEKPHTCETCGKGYPNAKGLKIHERSHTGERPYPCKICGKAFLSYSNLQNHVAGVHEGKKPYSCSTCGKQFRVAKVLTVHERIHTGEKPFTCETCGLGFVKAAALVIHARTHTGEKPFECDICGKKYGSVSILCRHKKSHADKLLMCDICGKKFGLAQHLKQHKRFHKEPIGV